jgi:hypothetical protein
MRRDPKMDKNQTRYFTYSYQISEDEYNASGSKRIYFNTGEFKTPREISKEQFNFETFGFPKEWRTDTEPYSLDREHKKKYDPKKDSMFGFDKDYSMTNEFTRERNRLKYSYQYMINLFKQLERKLKIKDKLFDQDLYSAHSGMSFNEPVKVSKKDIDKRKTKVNYETVRNVMKKTVQLLTIAQKRENIANLQVIDKAIELADKKNENGIKQFLEGIKKVYESYDNNKYKNDILILNDLDDIININDTSMKAFESATDKSIVFLNVDLIDDRQKSKQYDVAKDIKRLEKSGATIILFGSLNNKDIISNALSTSGFIKKSDGIYKNQFKESNIDILDIDKMLKEIC